MNIVICIVGKGNDELLDGANKIQDLTLDSLGRTQAMIAASKEVGTATIEGNVLYSTVVRTVHFSNCEVMKNLLAESNIK